MEDLSSTLKTVTPSSVWILVKDNKPYRANTYKTHIRLFTTYNRAKNYLDKYCRDEGVTIVEYIPKI